MTLQMKTIQTKFVEDSILRKQLYFILLKDWRHTAFQDLLGNLFLLEFLVSIKLSPYVKCRFIHMEDSQALVSSCYRLQNIKI